MKPIDLRTRLVLSFVLVALVPLAVTLLLTIYVMVSQFRKASIADIVSVRELIRADIDRKSADLEERSEGVMHRYELRELLFRFAERPQERAQAQWELIRLTRSMSDELGLALMEIADGRGVIVASAQEPAQFGVQDLSLPPLIEAGKKAGKPFIAVRRGLTMGGLALITVRPFEGGEGGENSLLVAGDLINEGFLDSLPHTAGTAVILAGSGAKAIVAQTNALGRTVAASLSAADVGQRWPRGDGIVDTTIGDKRCFVGAVSLPGVTSIDPAALYVVSSRESLSAVLRRLELLFLLIAALGCALAGGLGYWSAGRIISPVRGLVDGLERVARGDLDTAVPVVRRDEIGRVADSFNRMTRDLKELREDLLRAERIAAWQEIARRLAHEIKNPLSPIQLCIETLRKSYERGIPNFEEILEESTRTILEEVQRLKKIVEEFSDFARVPKPVKAPEDMHARLQRVEALYAGVRDRYELKTRLSARISVAWFDAGQIDRVLINLIKNAMEAMPDGGPIEIDTANDENGRVLQVRIADRGRGISEERRQNLFRPYSTDKPGGTGLGLAIAHRIVSEHAGQVRGENRPGGGAVFTVEIPVGGP